jgi:hypothetical protein
MSDFAIELRDRVRAHVAERGVVGVAWELGGGGERQGVWLPATLPAEPDHAALGRFESAPEACVLPVSSIAAIEVSL